MDKLVRGTAKDGMVRVIGAITTDIVNLFLLHFLFLFFHLMNQ